MISIKTILDKTKTGGFRKPLKHKGNPLNHLYDTTPIKKQIPIW